MGVGGQLWAQVGAGWRGLARVGAGRHEFGKVGMGRGQLGTESVCQMPADSWNTHYPPMLRGGYENFLSIFAL